MPATRNPNCMRARAEAMLDRGASNEQIMAAIPCTVHQARCMRSRWKKPDHYKAIGDDWRRRQGILTHEEYVARQRAKADARLAKVQPLLEKGLSWREAAKAAGISHNVIAGLTYRARQANKGNTA